MPSVPVISEFDRKKVFLKVAATTSRFVLIKLFLVKKTREVLTSSTTSTSAPTAQTIPSLGPIQVFESRPLHTASPVTSSAATAV